MRKLTGKINRRTVTLKTSTIREFDGGLNVIDSQYVLSSKFAAVLRNMYRAPDGSLQVRQGTRLFTDLQDQLESDVVNQEYYNGFIVAVGQNGYISVTDGTGVSYRVWDDNIAGTKPSAPSGWGFTDFVSFTPFKNKLTVWNGVDKPLIIDTTMSVDYLVDLATLSNGNTPIGKYAATHNEYVCVAGMADRPSVLAISAKGTSGTYLGDPIPNDATEIDLAVYIEDGDPTIKGIKSFRDKLLVAFESNVIIMTLGTYDDSGNHLPKVDDTIPAYGAVSHRSLQNLGDDVLLADIVGVPNVKRALFTGTIQPNRLSQLIDPLIQQDMARLSNASLEDRVLSIYNRIDGQYMLFVPNTDDAPNTIETRGFIYTRIDELKVKAWAEFTGWNWTSACRSQAGRIFFSQGTRLFLLGNQNDPIYADRMGYEEGFDDGTSFTDMTGFTPITSFAVSGIPIYFDWELPWADFDKRMNVKKSKYVSFDVQGDGRYTLEMYVDNLYQDKSKLGETFTDDTYFSDGYGFERFRNEPYRTPELSMEFIGGDSLGFGANFGNYFGAGRTTQEEKLYKWEAEFKIAKLRLFGYTRDPLRFASISLAYQQGSIRR